MRDANALQQCYARVFEGEAGHIVLADLEARSFVRDTSFTPDPQRAAFNEGRRSLMLHIQRMLDRQAVTRSLATDGLSTPREA
jgi:hypothetical protein